VALVSDVVALAAVAGRMVLVILSESLGAAQTFATKYGYEIDPDQEMIALGVANAGSDWWAGSPPVAVSRRPR
jgi:SulP family sulfate permease